MDAGESMSLEAEGASTTHFSKRSTDVPELDHCKRM